MSKLELFAVVENYGKEEQKFHDRYRLMMNLPKKDIDRISMRVECDKKALGWDVKLIRFTPAPQQETKQ